MASRNAPDDRNRRSTGAVSLGDRTGGARGGRFPWWLLALLALLALALLFLGLRACGDDDDDSIANPVASATSAAASAAGRATSAAASAAASATAAAPTGVPTGAATGVATPGTGTGAGAGGGAGTGTLTASGTALLPLATQAGAGGDLSRYVGQPTQGQGVLVESVPSDEGFWVGSSAADRVFVSLVPQTGESPFQVRAGQRVSFTGTTNANPAGFADRLGVTAPEGADLLTAQKAHIEVQKSALQQG